MGDRECAFVRREQERGETGMRIRRTIDPIFGFVQRNGLLISTTRPRCIPLCRQYMPQVDQCPLFLDRDLTLLCDLTGIGTSGVCGG